ncbi:MAG TPA: 7-cyano-7-deazaguanine synthase QueC [Gaiellaceae bacterium]|nr:7-cyano-7-deazaguanine synthase QueC [Gaiellaceae bacterium]
MKRAVVLLSGGLDSATSLAVARDEGYETYALTVRYGQRHEAELEAAARVAAALGARRHLVVSVELGAIGGSALTDDVEVPKDQSLEEIGTGIPVTYVPARNTVFLSLALGWAEVLEAEDVFMGVTAIDYSGYPDCRPEYIRAFEAMANLATKAAVEGRQRLRIHTPLIDLDKAAIIRLGTSFGVDYGLTHSCYDPAPDGTPCGRCDACLLRLDGFRRAGLEDPLRYAS